MPLPPLEVQEQIVAEIEGYQKIVTAARQIVETYKPHIAIDPSWPMVELGEVCNLTYGYTDTALDEGDARFIRITDIGEDGLLRENDIKYIRLNDEAKKYLLSRGDVLVARTGATYGKTLYFDLDFPAVFASYLIKLSFDKDKVIPKYYWVFTLSDSYDEQKRRLMTGGGQPQFSANLIKKIRIPLPDTATQNLIVLEAEKEAELINANKQLIEIFEQKIKDELAKVWNG